MLDPVEADADLTGEVMATQELFFAWLRIGSRQTKCPCAQAVMRYAIDLQGTELRGAVGPDTAWELCCRTLSLAPEAKSIRSGELAQLIVYWIDSGEIPGALGHTIYAGMKDDLNAAKTFERRLMRAP